MPICDGVEAAKRLRMLESKLNVPVILPSSSFNCSTSYSSGLTKKN